MFQKNSNVAKTNYLNVTKNEFFNVTKAELFNIAKRGSEFELQN